jgi:hypothetical protein
MRNALLAIGASTLLVLFTGCACNNCCSNSGNSSAAGTNGRQQDGQQQAGPGGVVSYPYYTNRGPRDFLETHPQSIGP